MADENGKRIELRMGSTVSTDGSGPADSGSSSGSGSGGPGAGYAPHDKTGAMDDASKPVMGYIAVAAGILAIFFNGFIFVPIAFVCSVIALLMGQGMWAFLGFMTAFAGLLTSPVLLAILGLGAMAAWFGLPISP